MSHPGAQNTNTNQNLPPEEIGYVPDKVKKAEKRIEACPYDTEAWSVLIRDAQMKKIEDARPAYERLVTQFSNAGRYWKIYIEHEVKHFKFSISRSALKFSFPQSNKVNAIRDMQPTCYLQY